jgi:4-hydroxy-3-polyprenylbenzoate decarboxylase
MLATMYRTLRQFLEALESAGELCRVPVEVDAALEVAEIADRQSKSPCPVVSAAARRLDAAHCDRGGRALLFERVRGCDFPLCINVFGSYRRTEMALGCAEGGFESIARKIAGLVRPEPPRGLLDMARRARDLLPLLRIPPRRVRAGPCHEIVRLARRGEVDLRRLPLIQCWPLDGDLAAVGWELSAQEAGRAPGASGPEPALWGRYVTFAGMHTIHVADARSRRPASHNIGMYRAQLLDATHLVMHWHVHHDGAAHWRSWKEARRPMPIAICFGGEPVLPYAATAPLPPGMSELLMAGFLNGRGIPLVRARTVPLWVPAGSEIVIEGYVSTEAGPIGWEPARSGGSLVEPLGRGSAVEGPFGDHTGYYSLPDRYPLVEVTAVTHRRGAVFPATIVGPPPQEDYYLGKATERIFAPLLRMLVPDLVDYHLPLFGCFHNCAFIAIRKAYPLQARRVMHAVWGAGQMAWEKYLIVVDDDLNVHDEKAVLAAIFANCDFRRDLEAVTGPLDILDHAAPRLGAGGKLGIDATRKIAGEDVAGVPVGGVPGTVVAGAAQREVLERALRGRAGIVAASVPELGRGRCVIVAVDKTRPGQGAEAIERVWQVAGEEGEAPEGRADLVVAVGAGVDVEDREQVLFHLCANSDPSRDLLRRGTRIGFDATAKMPGDERNGRPVRAWPPVIGMSAAMKEQVSRRRAEYGLP